MGIIFRLIYGYLLLKDWYPKMNRIRFSLLSDMAVSYFLWGQMCYRRICTKSELQITPFFEF